MTYVKHYPGIPQFKNQLSVAYEKSGNKYLAQQVNKAIREEHPEYLFGFLNEVNQLVDAGEVAKASKMMETYHTVQDWEPERKVFHFTELSGFEMTMVNLLLAQDNLEAAESRLPGLKDLNYPATYQRAKNLIDNYKADLEEKTLEEGLDEGNRGKYWPQTQTPPTFHHTEINHLYLYDLTIDQRILQAILALPRETLVQDLRAMLHDSLVRLDYFQKDIVPVEATWFPFHVMALLAELEADEAIPEVLDMLRANSDYLDFWWSDAITEEVPKLLVKLLKGNPEPLREFLKEPNHYSYLRVVASETLVWMVRKDKSLREQVLDIYKDLFGYYLEHQNNLTITDPEVNSFLICDAIDLNAYSLEQEIKRLYDNYLVLEWICGDWKSVKRDLKKLIRPIAYEALTLEELYEEWVSFYHTEQKGQPNSSFTSTDWNNSDWDFTPIQETLAAMERGESIYNKPEQAVSTKISRNEPCPCGSGKKYKRCCGA